MTKTKYLQIRLDEGDLETYQRVSAMMGMKLSEFARMVMKSGVADILSKGKENEELALGKLERYLVAKKEWMDST